MGERDSLHSLLEANLSSMKELLVLHTQQIDSLRIENRELKLMLKNVEKTALPKDPLSREVMTKVRRNKKEMIKNKILEIIRLHSYSIPEAKEHIVDRLGYCSKATFYRYLEELRLNDIIMLSPAKILKIKPFVDQL